MEKKTFIRLGILLSALLIATVPAAGAPDRCEAFAARTIAFIGANTKDVLEATASGADCAKAVVTISIRQQDAMPIAAFATPLAWLNEPLATSGKVTQASLEQYLKAYVEEAQLDIAASTLPIWTRKSPTPGFDQGVELTSPLDRKTYARLRQSKPNMLCLNDAHETGVCFVWDRLHSVSEVILRR